MFCPRDFFSPLSVLVIMRSRKVSEYLYDNKQIYSGACVLKLESPESLRNYLLSGFITIIIILVTTGLREGQGV